MTAPAGPLQVPDPAPEIVITLPKRGKVRVTTVEEADALIAQACKAKAMILRARLDGQPPPFTGTLPPPCAQRPPDNSPGECVRLEGHPVPHRNLAGYEWGEEEGGGEDAIAILQDLLLLAGVRVPLSAIAGWTGEQFRAAEEWAAAEHLHASDNPVVRMPKPEHVTAAQVPDAEPHPVHHWDQASGEQPCHDQHEDSAGNGTGTEIWLCTAQAGHGGPDHIAYGTYGEELRRWPRHEWGDEEGEDAIAAIGEAIADGTVAAAVADARPVGEPGACTAHAATPGINGVLLDCWRPVHDHGWHVDQVCHLAWRRDGDGSVITRPVPEAARP